MDGFVTGSVVNASATSNAIYDWEKIYADYDKALLSPWALSLSTRKMLGRGALLAVMAKYNAERTPVP